MTSKENKSTGSKGRERSKIKPIKRRENHMRILSLKMTCLASMMKRMAGLAAISKGIVLEVIKVGMLNWAVGEDKIGHNRTLIMIDSLFTRILNRNLVLQMLLRTCSKLRMVQLLLKQQCVESALVRKILTITL